MLLTLGQHKMDKKGVKLFVLSCTFNVMIVLDLLQLVSVLLKSKKVTDDENLLLYHCITTVFCNLTAVV